MKSAYLVPICCHQHPLDFSLDAIPETPKGLHVKERRYRHRTSIRAPSSGWVLLCYVSSSNLCLNMIPTPNCGLTLTSFHAQIYNVRDSYTRHRLDEFCIEWIFLLLFLVRRLGWRALFQNWSEVRMCFDLHLYSLILLIKVYWVRRSVPGWPKSASRVSKMNLLGNRSGDSGSGILLFYEFHATGENHARQEFASPYLVPRARCWNLFHHYLSVCRAVLFSLFLPVKSTTGQPWRP